MEDKVTTSLLYLNGVNVSFDGFKALNNLSLALEGGEMRAIIGPNGAGKTTMMDVITGKTRPDAGKVFFGSTIDLLRLTEPQIAQIGVGRKFQKPTVYEQLTVFENLELALRADRRVRASLFSRLSGAQLDRIGEVLQLIHLKEEENPFKAETREFPVDFGSPVEKVLTVRISLPEGYTVDEMPQSRIFRLPDGSAKYAYNVVHVGNIISVTSNFQINKNMYVQDEYPNLREFYNQVISKQAEQIVLKKK
jgi:ABC-type sugar transport system ATPase subunit